MGEWSVSIMGNDTAEDLKSEFQVAFAYYEVDEAVRILDKYFRDAYLDDEDDYPNYIYSLALFMYNKGLLTEDVKKRALDCIEQNKGLAIYAESGERTLNKRIKVLSDFKVKITSPLPPKKKIKLDVCSVPIFTVGDMIALKIQTVDKQLRSKYPEFDEETHSSMHGKYFVMQKVKDHISWTSPLNSSVRDIWPKFLLYNYLGDTVPTADEVKNLQPVYHNPYRELVPRPYFIDGEQKMYYYKRRDYCLIGNYEIQDNVDYDTYDLCYASLFGWDFDRDMLSALLK